MTIPARRRKSEGVMPAGTALGGPDGEIQPRGLAKYPGPNDVGAVLVGILGRIGCAGRVRRDARIEETLHLLSPGG